MHLIKHRFLGRPVPVDSRILVVGTFNPETKENKAEFFYGRSRNHLWRLIPLAFGKESLKEKDISEKENFISQYKIGFIDIISEVFVDDPANYKDDYLDSKVKKWRDVIDLIKKMPELRKVCFTRKTFSGIPNIKKQVDMLKEYCEDHGIEFQYLPTPARIYNKEKQNVWTAFFKQ